MSRYVTDTMALVLFLEKRRIPAGVKQIFLNTEKGLDEIIIPAMTLAEIAYLHEKGRVATSLVSINNLIRSHPNFSVFPMDFQVISSAFLINDIPELHDRVIAGTANQLSVPLLTNDPVISRSVAVTCIWT